MISSRLGRFLLPLIILWLAFGLRLYRLDFQSIWWDEGHSIFVASHPIPQIPTLPAMDVHPPAYFVLLNRWLALTGSSEFALRYLSVIFSLLTIALLWPFAHTLTPTPSSRFQNLLKNDTQPPQLPNLQTSSAPWLPRSPAPWLPRSLAPFLATLSPLYVAYAQEVRSYAMITFLALGSTLALWQIIKEQSTPHIATGAPTIRNTHHATHHTFSVLRFSLTANITFHKISRLAFYILLSAACLYTHYFSIFLLLFHNLIWVGWVIYITVTTRRISGVTQRYPKRAFLLWFGSQLAIFLLFLPQLRLALRQVTAYTNPNLAPPSLIHFISHTWQAYTVGLTIDPTPARWGMWGVLGVLVISNLLLVIANYQLPITIFFLTAWFTIPLAAYFLVLQRQPSFEPRYAMLVTPALFLLLAVGLSGVKVSGVKVSGVKVSGVRCQVSNYTLRATFYASLTILTTIFAFGLYSYYTNEAYFKDDSAGVAAWLAQETTADDIVYVDVPHPFHYYQADIPAPMRYLFVDIHSAAQTLNREAADKARLYWVTWRGSDTDPRGVIPFLVEKVGRPLGQRDFKGYNVRWYELPAPESVFSLPRQLKPAQAIFGDTLQLDGLAYARMIEANRPVWVTLHFSLLRPTPVDYKVSARLRDAAGNIIQADRDLLNDRHFRTSAWPLNDPALNQAINVYTLPLAPPGQYQLEVIVYNAEPPYPSEGVSGVESNDGVSAILGRVTVMP